MISNEKLLIFNQRGLIPGPLETESDFLNRIDKQLDPLIEEDWKETISHTQKNYDFAIDWVRVKYENRKLSFWQGAATWISDQAPVIQLKKAFQKGSYLGIYTHKEVLGHEFAHVARMHFNEPRFEELLAYQLSESRFRRWWGPLFTRSWESYLFVFLLLFSLGMQVASFYWENFSLMWMGTFLPLLGIGIAALRLGYSHLLFRRCLKKLKLLVKEKAHYLIFRLTDEEIASFAKFSKEEIEAYIAKQDELRWKVIKLAYTAPGQKM